MSAAVLAQGDEHRAPGARCVAARPARAAGAAPTRRQRRAATARSACGAHIGAPRRRAARCCCLSLVVATPFFTFQIGAQALALGLIALSLTFLGGYGGMVSLAQMTVAGIAGYMVAIFGTSGTADISLGWPWWLARAARARDGDASRATLIGWLSVRTEGIYTIMITLAIGVAFFYLAQQNYAVFNGFQGFQQVVPPTRVRRRLARAAAVLLPRAGLRAGRLLLREATCCARRSASRCRASATTRGA